MARVLVVDDKEDVRLALTTILLDEGHQVTEASDGDEVLSCISLVDPEIILLDIAMRRLDGFETLASLAADERTRDIPVIMLTARGRPEDRHRARQLGAKDYINKPWEKGEVELRVDWALKARGATPGRG